MFINPVHAVSSFSTDDVSLYIEGFADKSKNDIKSPTVGEESFLKFIFANNRDRILNYFMTVESDSDGMIINTIGRILPETSRVGFDMIMLRTVGDDVLTVTVHDLGETAAISRDEARTKPIIGQATVEYSVISKPTLNQYADLLENDSVTVSHVKLLSDTGAAISDIHENQEYVIKSLLESNFDQGVEYVYGINIQDEDQNTVYENEITRHLLSNTYDFVSLPWMPTQSGKYTITVNFWDNIEDRNLIAESHMLTVTVLQDSKSEEQDMAEKSIVSPFPLSKKMTCKQNEQESHGICVPSSVQIPLDARDCTSKEFCAIPGDYLIIEDNTFARYHNVHGLDRNSTNIAGFIFEEFTDSDTKIKLKIIFPNLDYLQLDTSMDLKNGNIDTRDIEVTNYSGLEFLSGISSEHAKSFAKSLFMKILDESDASTTTISSEQEIAERVNPQINHDFSNDVYVLQGTSRDVLVLGSDAVFNPENVNFLYENVTGSGFARIVMDKRTDLILEREIQVSFLSNDKEIMNAHKTMKVLDTNLLSEQEDDKTTSKTTTFSFIDPDEDPQHYVDRYYNEPKYKDWFDRNYPGYTIEDAAGVSKLVDEIPEWIKNNADWWATDKIDDATFVSGIEFLIKNNMVEVPHTGPANKTTDEVPEWIKNNADWWAQGLLSDDEFLKGIQYLVEQGIIQV